MKLAVAQIRPIVGKVEQNVARHLELADLASRLGARLVLFPELSLTGYEPQRASELARSPADACFDRLQKFCDESRISIGVGVPTLSGMPPVSGVPAVTCVLPEITCLLFRPEMETVTYSKAFLHPDEEQHFRPGGDSPALIVKEPPIALAICFEISVPGHVRRAVDANAIVYAASVAKTASGVSNASRRLSEVAAKFSLPVLMANCLGFMDGAECGGLSSVWDRHGQLVGQLDEDSEGVIVFDHKTGETTVANLQL